MVQTTLVGRQGPQGNVARPGERAGRVPPAYGPCEPESREGYTPGRGPPYARVVTLTLLLSCVSPCVAASPGRVLAGVRWGFSPCVFRSWLVLW